MNLVEIPNPKLTINGDVHLGSPIPPIDRLKIISPGEFEHIILEWASDYLKSKYHTILQVGGAGDKGRDIVAHYDMKNLQVDIFQCKHYKSPISPSEYWIEFGKLCYYTFQEIYKVPVNYYIVASCGVGPALRTFLDNPATINEELIKQWDKHCKDAITKNEQIILTPALEEYIRNFDFNIVSEIPPLKLIDEYSKTKWFKFRFGGGLKKRPKTGETTLIPDENEAKLPFISQLLQVYSKLENKTFNKVEDLIVEDYYKEHLYNQRCDFHSAQALKHFSREEFINDEPFENLKMEIYKGIFHCQRKNYQDDLERVDNTLEVARSISIDGNPLGTINPSDKTGLCHELVNDSKMKWVK